jgi:anti-anti-sigma regulatory factor
VPVTLEENDTVSLIRLEGAIDIGTAAELKTLLVQALEPGENSSGKEVRIALAGATELDVTAVQLLWAAEREAKKAGAGFSFTGPIPNDISAALGAAGLQQFLVVESKGSANAI